ncbi:MAG: TetR family transcriptional regulator [Tannerellaceae bacterium]|nr:TetR family transcriptional regulator [Tannerellaceae bacterium]
MKPRKNTKDLILLEAFRLFATKTYEQVTFTELEEKTELTRGAIMYHFKTKELIFTSMCDKYLLQETSILDKLESKIEAGISLKNFINEFIQSIHELKEKTKELGIDNYSKALINITNQTQYYYPGFNIKAAKWQIMQILLWKRALKAAVRNQEIRNDTDCEEVAELFEDIHCGISYASIVYPDGIDIQRLQKAFYYLYQSLLHSNV